MATTSKNEPDSTVINNIAVGLYYYYIPHQFTNSCLFFEETLPSI